MTSSKTSNACKARMMYLHVIIIVISQGEYHGRLLRVCFSFVSELQCQ